MLDFFIALFGGIYYSGKYLSYKSNKRKDDRWFSDSQNIQNSIKASIDEEQEIENILCDKRRKMQLLNTISVELSEIYGASWDKEFATDESYVNYTCLSNPSAIAYHILLSKQGKVPCMFSSRYDLFGKGEEIKRTIKACEIIERNIQKKNPKLRILFVPGTKITNSKVAEFYDELYRGKLYWEHNIPLPSAKWNPPLKRLW